MERWRWKMAIYLKEKFDNLSLVAWSKQQFLLDFGAPRVLYWNFQLNTMRRTCGIFCFTNTFGDLFDFLLDFERWFGTVDELLDHLGVDIVSHLLDNIDGEVGDLLVEYVFFFANKFEDADELRDWKFTNVALLDCVFDVEASYCS